MKRLCKIEGCGETSRYRDWCYMHYSRWYRHGDPLKTKRNMDTVTWQYLISCSAVNHKTGCIEWQKGTSEGYGAAFFNGSVVRTHRISYLLNIGSIPGRLFVCHHCDNKLCINPDHLFLGTQKDNISDASNKGRMVRGEKHYMAKLTEKDVISIRKMNGPHKDIAKMFGVSASNISAVKRRKIWQWLT